MAELHKDRAELLADVSEMYFVKGKTQHEISLHVGVSRSMVSRLLDEARRKGIVEIKVHHPITLDEEIQTRLIQRFGLKEAYVTKSSSSDAEHLMQNLGRCGAYALKLFLKAGQTLGVAWGTSVYAVAEALEVDHPIPVKIVQLVGALGSRDEKYDGHALVQTLAKKLGGEPYYLNAPFQVDSEDTVKSLFANSSLNDTFEKFQHCDIALVGVGSTEAKYSSYYKSGYLTREEVDELYEAGATGGVCGIHFDRHGILQAKDFQKRLVSIAEESLKNIPLRIGVACGVGKVIPILGALNGRYINALVTDLKTAQEVLKLDAAG